MAVQMDYSGGLAPAFEGMIVNTEPNNLISRRIEGDEVGFGKAVKQGAADAGCAAATAAADVFRGVTVLEVSANPASDDGNGFGVGAMARLMERGVIWVVAGEAVSAGEAAYMQVGTADAGKFVSTASGNLPVPNAMFDSSGAKDALVKLRIK